MINNEDYKRKQNLPQSSYLEQSFKVNNVLNALSVSANSKNLPSTGSAFSAPGLLIQKNDIKQTIKEPPATVKVECYTKNISGTTHFTETKKKSNESIIFYCF